MNQLIVNLMEYPQLDWHGRQALLMAEAEREQLQLYGLDLLWMLTKTKYEGELPQPSTLIKRGYKAEERPKTAAEIKQYVIDRLTELEGSAEMHVVKGSDIINGTHGIGGKAGS